MIIMKTSKSLPFLCLLVLTLGGIVVPSSSSSSSRRVSASSSDLLQHVEKQCGFTRYPKHCIETLLELSRTQELLGKKQEYGDHNVILSLVENVRDETERFSTSPSSPSSNPSSLFQLQRLNAPEAESSLGYCGELMEMSLKHLNTSLTALRDSPTRRKSDIQTWLSAVLTFQHTCIDTLTNSNHSNELYQNVYSKMSYVSRVTSNSLALVNRITNQRHDIDRASKAAKGEAVFPEWVSKKDRKLLQTPAPIRADAVVAQDGSGNYKTVSDAIKAASGGRRFVIYVKAGVYIEKIRSNKDGITLIGDGKYSTIIAFHDSNAAGTIMPNTATFAITGDGFIARDIGFQNNAGPKGGQALALSVVSDRSVLYRCSIVGYQDTLYALALRQFYRECDIYGTIDFIFGNAAAVFQNCDIVLRKPLSGSYDVILANGRQDPGQNTGFSIQRSRIMVSPDLSPWKHSIESYLGRPWKEYSRAIIMQTVIDDAIKPRGWIEWSGSFALKTLYFAEYLNSGPGAGTSSRVRWPGYHVIGPEEAAMFTVSKLIGGNAWLPSTGVNFIAGLV